MRGLVRPFYIVYHSLDELRQADSHSFGAACPVPGKGKPTAGILPAVLHFCAGISTPTLLGAGLGGMAKGGSGAKYLHVRIALGALGEWPCGISMFLLGIAVVYAGFAPACGAQQ